MVAGSLGAGVELRRWGGPAGPAPDLTAPAMVAPPQLAGEGRIGEPLAVDEGVWSGSPSPVLARQWLRDGAAIPGATGATYLPDAADDGGALGCRVTATNAAGSASAETGTVVAVHAPPVAMGALADRSYFQGSGAQVVAAAGGFAGGGLRFAAQGAGAAADPVTGEVAIPTAEARAATTVTVTATNSGGAATQAFAVVVVGAPVAASAPQTWDTDAEGGEQSFDAAPHFAAAGDPDGATLSYALVDGDGVAVEAGSIVDGVFVARADGYLRIAPETGLLTLDAGAIGSAGGS